MTSIAQVRREQPRQRGLGLGPQRLSPWCREQSVALVVLVPVPGAHDLGQSRHGVLQEQLHEVDCRLAALLLHCVACAGHVPLVAAGKKREISCKNKGIEGIGARTR